MAKGTNSPVNVELARLIGLCLAAALAAVSSGACATGIDDPNTGVYGTKKDDAGDDSSDGASGFGGTGGAVGAGGSGNASGSSGSGGAATCNPAFCPNSGLGVPCCTDPPDDECGMDNGGGCKRSD
jgi:hypothetical protein